MSEQTVEFVSLNGHDDYEILNQYPFTIRRKDNHYEVNTFNDKGYIAVCLNRKKYRIHVLIANQFIENDDPEHKTVVDHINRDKTDFHIENLRFTTQSINVRNRTSTRTHQYQFVNELPDDAIAITDYEIYHKSGVKIHYFENYYYHDNQFYFYNGNDYRILHINEYKDGVKFVNITTIEHKVIRVQLSKFKKLYGFI